MKMYKKMWVLALICSMVTVLGGCGSSESKNESDSAESTGQKVELEMIFWDSNQESGLKAMADGFMKQNSNITVTVETVPWNEYWTKLQAAALRRNQRH